MAAPQARDISLVPGGVTALGSFQGSGQIQQYQVANVSAGGGLVGGNSVVSQIANNTITANQLAANAITAASIANNTITGAQLANNTVSTNQLDPAVVQHTVTTLNQTQIQALGVGVNIAVPTVNVTSLVFDAASLSFDTGATVTAFTGGANLVVQSNAANIISANIPATVITGNANSTGFAIVASGQQPLLANTPIVLITANAANFAAGSNTATARIDCWFKQIGHA